MNAINLQLQLAQDFHAAVTNVPVPVKKLVELGQLIDSENTVKPAETPVKLATEPTVYRTPDGQFEVLNPRQVVFNTKGKTFHPDRKIMVTWITAEHDLPMARLLFGIVEPAQLFGEIDDIDDLIHAAYSNNHQTALMKRYLFPQAVNRPITTAELEGLCGCRARKSTINERKKILGYTQPGRGCKAKSTSADTNDTCPV